MTPEEKAVVQAAVYLRYCIDAKTADDPERFDQLLDVVDALIFSCPKCNTGGHTCPGDGEPIGHGDADCGEHDDDEVKPSEERQHLARQLRDIGQGAMQEWMRIVDLEDGAGISFQARINWQNDDGLCMIGLYPYDDDLGTFRLTVSVEDLGPHQPHGPETDPAMVHEQAQPEVWVRTEMRHARVGDVIRPAGAFSSGPGTRVLDRYLPAMKDGSNAGHWHVISGGAKHWDDRIVQPGEVWLVLEGNDQPQNLRPDFEIEIKMSQNAANLFTAGSPFNWEDRMDAR